MGENIAEEAILFIKVPNKHLNYVIIRIPLISLRHWQSLNMGFMYDRKSLNYSERQHQMLGEYIGDIPSQKKNITIFLPS